MTRKQQTVREQTPHQLECDARLAAFLEGFKPPGIILDARVWGSNSHNTQVESSDWDFAGIYAAWPIELLGMRPPSDKLQHDNDAKQPGECDYAFYEAAKWAGLLLKGNPGIIESLFAEVGCHTDKMMKDLIDNSHLFVSRRVIKQYTGYASGQLERARKGSYLHTKGGKVSEKWLYHIFRLLGDARDLIIHRKVQVYKADDSKEREALLAIRQGGYEVEEMLVRAEREIGLVDSLDVSHLPEEGDADMLQGWLVRVRTRMFKMSLGLE